MPTTGKESWTKTSLCWNVHYTCQKHTLAYLIFYFTFLWNSSEKWENK